MVAMDPGAIPRSLSQSKSESEIMSKKMAPDFTQDTGTAWRAPGGRKQSGRGRDIHPRLRAVGACQGSAKRALRTSMACSTAASVATGATGCLPESGGRRHMLRQYLKHALSTLSGAIFVVTI